MPASDVTSGRGCTSPPAATSLVPPRQLSEATASVEHRGRRFCPATMSAQSERVNIYVNKLGDSRPTLKR
jgi:hypothetical protein